MIIEKIEIQKAIEIFLDGLRSQGKADSTVIEYSRILDRFNNFLCNININFIDEVNHIIVDNFLSHCEKYYTLQYKTKYKYYAFLSNFFTEMYNLSMNREIPTNKIVLKRPQMKEIFFYLNYNEIEKIIDVAKGQSDKLRSLTDSCFIRMLAETGVRRSDALSLKWNQVKLHKKEIDVYISKNKKEITIPITQPLFDSLLELKSYIRPNVYDNIFLSNKMEKLSPNTATNYFNKYVERSNVVTDRIKQIESSSMPKDQNEEAITRIEVTFHTLKHSFITRCFLEGKSIEEIEKLTGNSDRDTLMKYKNMLASDFTVIADTLNKLKKS